ncbi:hypothetical protein [Azorhizobium caulinodans]|uniref:hypothetical protein n=1 Tax=Azorhizobium caulinodans TaxID=7 RepID=UPI0011D06B52|nr:hypothetical protein [Azorhizobium caulinodans]
MNEDEAKARLQQLRDALARREEKPVPRVQAYSGVDSDDAARKEASALASGDLEAEAAKKEHSRTERFRDHVAIAILIVFWAGFLSLSVLAVLWFINFIIPPEKAILTSSQSERIISFLTGGGLTSFVANYAKKRLT